MILIECDLLLPCTIGLHPPDLHGACWIGVVINIFSIGRIFGTVDMALRIKRKLYFAASVYRLLVEIVNFRSALGYKTYFLIIWIPSMPVRRRLFCKQSRLTSGKWKDINGRSSTRHAFSRIADGQHLSIE